MQLFAAATPATAQPPKTQTAPAGRRLHSRRFVVIVGAGVGGLTLSHALARRGVPHVVLERETEPGGVIRTIRVDGRVLELGPQRLRLTLSVRELVSTLKLEGELILAPADLPLLIYRRGSLRLAPLSLKDVFRTNLFSLAGKLRLLAEPLTRGARAGETAAEYLERRFGKAAYQDLLGPLFGGLYASDPADMLAHHALLPALRELDGERSTIIALLRRALRRDGATPCSFRSGMRTLTDAMYGGVRQHVRLASRVLGVERDADHYRVITRDDALTATDIVLTCPAAEAAALLRELAPGASAALENLTYNHIAIVHLVAEGVQRAMGYQVSFGEPLHSRGVTFNHYLFDRASVYTAFLGGARDPGLVRRRDDEIAALAADEFRLVTGVSATPIHVARASLPAWDRTWTALDALALPGGVHLCANYESRIGIPGRIARARQLATDIAG